MNFQKQKEFVIGCKEGDHVSDTKLFPGLCPQEVEWIVDTVEFTDDGKKIVVMSLSYFGVFFVKLKATLHKSGGLKWEIG